MSVYCATLFTSGKQLRLSQKVVDHILWDSFISKITLFVKVRERKL